MTYTIVNDLAADSPHSYDELRAAYRAGTLGALLLPLTPKERVGAAAVIAERTGWELSRVQAKTAELVATAEAERALAEINDAVEQRRAALEAGQPEAAQAAHEAINRLIIATRAAGIYAGWDAARRCYALRATDRTGAEWDRDRIAQEQAGEQPFYNRKPEAWAALAAERSAEQAHATIERAAIFDALVAAYDAMRVAASDPDKVARAFDWLISQERYRLDTRGALLIPSESRAGVVYRVWVYCDCPAPRSCWHQIAAEMIGRANRASRPVPFAVESIADLA